MTALPRRCVRCKTLIARGSRCAACTTPKANTTTRGYGSAWATLSKAVLRRDGYVCTYCGRRATTADHVVPKARGGTNDLSNLVAACRACNGRKGARISDQARR